MTAAPPPGIIKSLPRCPMCDPCQIGFHIRPVTSDLKFHKDFTLSLLNLLAAGYLSCVDRGKGYLSRLDLVVAIIVLLYALCYNNSVKADKKTKGEKTKGDGEMRTAYLVGTCLIIQVVLLNACLATTYYVNPEESIQDSIDSATHGDTIVVYPGIYYENIHFNGKNLILTNTNPDSPAIVANTIIDGLDSGSVVTFDGSETMTCVLTGFTIRNGTGTLEFGNVVRHGGGIIGRGTHANIRHNIITRNSAERGG